MWELNVLHATFVPVHLFKMYWQGAPSVTETFIDSKKEVDNQLKKTCEDFIALVTNMLIGPLKTFLDKVSHFYFFEVSDAQEHVTSGHILAANKRSLVVLRLLVRYMKKMEVVCVPLEECILRKCSFCFSQLWY